MAALTEITGYFVREFQRWDSTAMLRIEIPAVVPDDSGQPLVTETVVKLDCDPDELQADQEYRFVGQWRNHPKYGRQFHATSFALIQPHTRQGVIRYLVHAGQGLRFGPVRAAALYDEWGQDAVRKCREAPAEVAALLASRRLQFDHAAAVNLQSRLGQDAALESTTLEVLDLLTGRGFPRATVRDVVKEWGARAAMVVRRDPYKLMNFRGCGFKRCDAMWIELGLPPGRLKRQALAAWYAIHSDTDGHTWYPVTVATAAIRNNVGGCEVNQEKALRLARLGGRLAEVTTDGNGAAGAIVAGGGTRWVAERRNADNEREIAEIVAEAMGEGVRWP